MKTTNITIITIAHFYAFRAKNGAFVSDEVKRQLVRIINQPNQ